MTVVAFVPDLMDRSRITAAIPDVRFVASVDELAAATKEGDVVVVDLGRSGVLNAVGELHGRGEQQTVVAVPHPLAEADPVVERAHRHAGAKQVGHLHRDVEAR